MYIFSGTKKMESKRVTIGSYLKVFAWKFSVNNDIAV